MIIIWIIQKARMHNVVKVDAAFNKYILLAR